MEVQLSVKTQIPTTHSIGCIGAGWPETGPGPAPAYLRFDVGQALFREQNRMHSMK
jgi:hypothetical protein